MQKQEIAILSGKHKIPVEYILDLCQPMPEDIVLVSGTLVEGMGNEESDLDVYVLTHRYPNSTRFNLDRYAEVSDKNDVIINNLSENKDVYSLYDYYGSTKIHIDIKFILTAEIDNIFSRISSAYRYLMEDENIYYLTHPLDLSYEESMLFHRLSKSIPIQSADLFESIRERSPVKQYCLVSYAEKVVDYFAVKDIQGAIKASQLEMAREITREQLINQVQATLFSRGVTNRNVKWIFYYCCKEAIFEKFPFDLNYILALPTRTKNEILEFISVSFEAINFCLSISREEHIFSDFDLHKISENLENSIKSRAKNDHDISQEAFRLRLAAFREIDFQPKEIIGI